METRRPWEKPRQSRTKSSVGGKRPDAAARSLRPADRQRPPFRTLRLRPTRAPLGRRPSGPSGARPAPPSPSADPTTLWLFSHPREGKLGWAPGHTLCGPETALSPQRPPPHVSQRPLSQDEARPRPLTPLCLSHPDPWGQKAQWPSWSSAPLPPPGPPQTPRPAPFQPRSPFLRKRTPLPRPQGTPTAQSLESPQPQNDACE